MKSEKIFVLVLVLIFASLALVACGGGEEAGASAEANAGGEYHTASLTDEARSCVECHATETHGIVSDWDNSRHAEEGVSCIDCHGKGLIITFVFPVW